jgi:hypothetical protein
MNNLRVDDGAEAWVSVKDHAGMLGVEWSDAGATGEIATLLVL